jgi:hypothetical protein
MGRVITIDARMLGFSGIGTYLQNLLENYTRMECDFSFRLACPRQESVREFESNRFTGAVADSSSLKGIGPVALPSLQRPMLLSWKAAGDDPRSHAHRGSDLSPNSSVAYICATDAESGIPQSRSHCYCFRIH